jgi:low temperature requirement protein LtrA
MSTQTRPRVKIVAPPLLHMPEQEGHRHSTWSELFFDLVYVAAFGLLARDLAVAFDGPAFAAYMLMFVPLAWSWAGFTVYNDRFDTPDMFHRLLTFLQVVGVANVALAADHGATPARFALSYAALRLLLAVQYRRAGAANPAVAPMCNHYARGITLAAALWLASVPMPEAWRAVTWVVAIAVDIITIPLGRHLLMNAPVSTSHIPERFSLLTIILIGAAVAELLHGALHHALTPGLAIVATAGLALAYALWWLYYDNLEGASLRSKPRNYVAWFFSHLALALGISLFGVGAGHLVVETWPTLVERLAFGLPVAATFLALAVLHANAGCPDATFKAWSRVGAALLVVPLAAAPLPAALLVSLVALLALAQLGVELKRYGLAADFMEAGREDVP